MISKGFYYSEMVSCKLIHTIKSGYDDVKNTIKLTERETSFLKLGCTELTYKEISEKMFNSPRTIDAYRDGLVKN